MTAAFFSYAYAEPQEGFVQEGAVLLPGEETATEEFSENAESREAESDTGSGGIQEPAAGSGNTTGNGPQPAGAAGPESEALWTADDSVSVELAGTEAEEGPELIPQTGVQMTFTYGYKNIAKSGRRLPFEVQISNHEKTDFSGTLVLEVPGSTENGSGNYERADIRYSWPVAVAAGETVSVREVISASEENGSVHLSLMGTDGVSVNEMQASINMQGSGPELLIGILSDHPDRLGYFRGLSVAGTALRTRIVELDPSDIPDTPAGLEQMDMIVMSDLDSRKMESADFNVIREWTKSGGALLVGTGARPSAAVELLSYIRDLEIGDGDEREIDMGMQYSKTGPDGAVIPLLVRDIFTAGGSQVMQSGDTAILTTIPSGNGVIGITAYDLCDIYAFCSEQIGYADELLQSVLGSARISRLVDKGSGSLNLYEAAGSLVGLIDPDRLPSASLYLLFALAYLGLISVGIYGYLRTRGLGIYYHAFVPIAAFVGALVVMAMSVHLRAGGLVADYAVIREINEASVTDEGFVRLTAPSRHDYRLWLPSSYEFLPIIRDAETDNSLYESVDERSVVELKRAEDGHTVEASGLKPFAASLFEYAAGGTEKGLETKITVFDEHISGVIRNHTGRDLEDAVLLMYGRVMRLGTIGNGTEVNLDNAELMTVPTGSPELLANFLTGIREISPDSRSYVRALRRTRLLRYYIDNNLRSYYGGARLIAFSDDEDIPAAFEANVEIEQTGTALICGFTDTTFSRGSLVWRTALSSEPKLISGEYDAAANTTRGSVVLEYSLGNDLNIRSVVFSELSGVFAGEEMVPFAGSMSLYNYQTGRYDLMPAGQRSFTADAVRPYLSPDNTLTARFVPDESGAAVPMFLPVPDVTGTER